MYVFEIELYSEILLFEYLYNKSNPFVYFCTQLFFFAVAHVAMRKSVVLRQTEHIRLNEMSSFSTKDCVIHGLSDSMFSPIERTHDSISCENHVYILKWLQTWLIFCESFKFRCNLRVANIYLFDGKQITSAYKKLYDVRTKKQQRARFSGKCKIRNQKTEMGIYCEAYQNGIYVSQIVKRHKHWVLVLMLAQAQAQAYEMGNSVEFQLL